MILVSFVNAFEYIHTMTAPIIQQQQQPSSMQNSNSAETWNNYEWPQTPQNNLTITLNNTTNAASNADSSYNSEDYEEMVQDGEESNRMMTQEEEDYVSDDSSSYTSEDIPELEETTIPENIFENPAKSLNWRDRHIDRNFCSYNEFHDYITAYHIEYNEYFGLPQQ